MIRHHAEPNINILSTRNLLFDSDVRQWSRPLMIPMHSLFAKSSNRKRDQFECDVIWFCFCFDFVCSQERYHLERGDAFEIGRPRSRGWKNFGRRWARGGRSWKVNNFCGRHMCIIPNCCCFKSFVWVYKTRVPVFSYFCRLKSCDYVTVLSCLYIRTEKLLNKSKVFEWKWNFWMKLSKLTKQHKTERKSKL